MRDGTHEGLVAVPEVGVDHLEMALVDRYVDRLADGAAAVMEPWRVVRELDEVLEVDQRRIPPAAGQITDERRTVGRGQDDVVAADLHRPERISGQLGELPRCGCAQRPYVPRVEVHRDAVNGGAGVLEELQRLGIVTNFHADIGQNSVRVALDERKSLFTEKFVRWDLPTDESRRVRPGAFPGAGRHSRRAPATAVPNLAHPNPLIGTIVLGMQLTEFRRT